MTVQSTPESAGRDDRLSGRCRAQDSIATDVRSEYERDVDRIHYNYYFRRLDGITQVSSGHGGILRHNRMTHSLKVAQVGRRLVQYLEYDDRNSVGIKAARGIDRDVVTAAGLLHDTGHPPFGHIGEQQLNLWAQDHGLDDGYEGNAQVLRIILNLTAHQRGSKELLFGLDLTRAVVAACVKYPWSSEEAKERQQDKWGYCEPEAEIFHKFVAPLLPGRGDGTLEAKIMDWADDITYAVHDLQDFYMDGIIPLHHLRRDSVADSNYAPVHNGEFSDFWQYATEKLRRSIDLSSDVARCEFEKYASKFPRGRYRGKREEDAQLGALASQIITDASKATTVTNDGRLHVDEEMKAAINVLKQVTWYYVIDHPDLVSIQIGQRARVDELCHKLYEWAQSCFKRHERSGQALTMEEQATLQRRLPVQLREFTVQLLEANDGSGAYRDRNHCYARAVIDYVASMTEVEFDGLWRRMCG
ncbi:MAG: deoxyguanosinetriphosphate triphosphohydrolase family protein [Pseudonocardiaceae bacterium]